MQELSLTTFNMQQPPDHCFWHRIGGNQVRDLDVPGRDCTRFRSSLLSLKSFCLESDWLMKSGWISSVALTPFFITGLSVSCGLYKPAGNKGLATKSWKEMRWPSGCCGSSFEPRRLICRIALTRGSFNPPKGWQVDLYWEEGFY